MVCFARCFKDFYFLQGLRKSWIIVFIDDTWKDHWKVVAVFRYYWAQSGKGVKNTKNKNRSSDANQKFI